MYHASEEFGTEDIQTSGGYFHMANVFFRQNKMAVANSLYEQVDQLSLYLNTPVLNSLKLKHEHQP